MRAMQRFATSARHLLFHHGMNAACEICPNETSDSSSLDVSIVIVNWNTREALRDCLASVFVNLKGLETEVFVVDNNSSDGSCEMVAEFFPQVSLIRNQQNRGFAAANNQAIRLAKGRNVLLLNSDTIVKGDVIPRSSDYLDHHPDVGVMGCRVLNRDGSVQLTCSRFPTIVNLVLLASGLFRRTWPRVLGRYQIREWGRDSERDVDTVTGCYMFVRKSAIEQVGLLDEAFFFYGEETDWCKRFWQSGWRLRFAPVGEIIHFGSLSSRKCNHKRDLMLTSGLIRFHRKHGGILAAFVAWAILAVFAVSRAAYWSLYALGSGRPEARQRRDHFLQVLLHYPSTWPHAHQQGGMA